MIFLMLTDGSCLGGTGRTCLAVGAGKVPLWIFSRVTKHDTGQTKVLGVKVASHRGPIRGSAVAWF
jgi:hypothetical protein